jgi:HEXXH motif-containing protein
MSQALHTDLVASYLSNGAEESFKRTLLVKYVFLVDVLRELVPPASGFADYIESNLLPLKSLSAQDVIADGTPFFWMNVDRCRNDPDNLASHSRHLVMLAFDSFFRHLPDGAEFKLSPVEGSDVVLPCLRIRVPAAGKAAVLRRLNSESLEIEVNGEIEILTLGAIDSKYQLPLLTIPDQDSAVLLKVNDPALVEKDYIETISLNSTSAISLNQKIGRSLEMIGEADAELGGQIKRLIKWYFPIVTKDPNTTHNSFTAKRLIGVMFVSEIYRFMPLLEAIVHEFHHTELYMLMASREVLWEDEHRLYYSPWREDARTIFGLFHACHVFSQVEEFYSRAAESVAFEDYREYIAQRRLELCQQLRLGLLQIRRDELPQTGREVFDFMVAQVDLREKEMQFNQNPLPRIIVHLDQWRQRHPELADSIILPVDLQLTRSNAASERG